ncbi:hypothetical protein HMPREF1584_00536 [Gardnerella vaginalis JCP8481A]|nr:hypothetical protein HMPREF1584_00536 [Gardnerella vaginalis JCP8481A]
MRCITIFPPLFCKSYVLRKYLVLHYATLRSSNILLLLYFILLHRLHKTF